MLVKLLQVTLTQGLGAVACTGSSSPWCSAAGAGAWHKTETKQSWAQESVTFKNSQAVGSKAELEEEQAAESQRCLLAQHPQSRKPTGSEGL